MYCPFFMEGIKVFCVPLKHCRFLGYLVSRPVYQLFNLTRHPTISGINTYLEKNVFASRYSLRNICFGKKNSNWYCFWKVHKWVSILKQVPQPVYNAQMPVLCFFGTISAWTKFIQKKSHQILPFHVELYW